MNGVSEVDALDLDVEICILRNLRGIRGRIDEVAAERDACREDLRRRRLSNKSRGLVHEFCRLAAQLIRLRAQRGPLVTRRSTTRARRRHVATVR